MKATHSPSFAKIPRNYAVCLGKHFGLTFFLADRSNELTIIANRCDATRSTGGNFMPTQNVNLTETLDQFVKQQVKTGLFNNASEVHRAALARMARDEEERSLRLEKLRQDIAVGDADIQAGRIREHTSAESLFDAITG
jgi:antitoxin ParD1/3/4